MAMVDGRVLSVNVGGVKEFEYNGRPARSAIWKSPVEGRVQVRGVNLDGDDQADRAAHGGPDKAVYATPLRTFVGGKRSLVVPWSSACLVKTSRPKGST